MKYQLKNLNTKRKLFTLKSPRRKNPNQSRKHHLRSLLKMMKMSQSKLPKKILLNIRQKRSSTNKKKKSLPLNQRAMLMTVKSLKVAKRQRSRRTSHTKSPLRREKHTTIALAVDQRISPSAMVLTMKRDALTSLLSLFLREKMRILMRSRKSVSAAANTTSLRKYHSAMEATRT